MQRWILKLSDIVSQYRVETFCPWSECTMLISKVVSFKFKEVISSLLLEVSPLSKNTDKFVFYFTTYHFPTAQSHAVLMGECADGWYILIKIWHSAASDIFLEAVCKKVAAFWCVGILLHSSSKLLIWFVKHFCFHIYVGYEMCLVFTSCWL